MAMGNPNATAGEGQLSEVRAEEGIATDDWSASPADRTRIEHGRYYLIRVSSAEIRGKKFTAVADSGLLCGCASIGRATEARHKEMCQPHQRDWYTKQ